MRNPKSVNYETGLIFSQRAKRLSLKAAYWLLTIYAPVELSRLIIYHIVHKMPVELLNWKLDNPTIGYYAELTLVIVCYLVSTIMAFTFIDLVFKDKQGISHSKEA